MTLDPADLYHALYDTTPEAVLALDGDLVIVAANPAAERLFSAAGAALVGRRLQSLHTDPRDFDRLRRTHYGPQSPASPRGFTARYRNQAGQSFDGETTTKALRDDRGDAGGFICIIRNISERLALKARLEASDIQLRAALSSAKEGAYTLNLTTGLGSIRGFINEFLGIPAADATISRTRWMENVHADDAAGVEEELAKIRAKPSEAFDKVYRVRRADGEYRWLHDRGRITEFTRTGEALRLSGVISDVTERQALEQRLADSERMLRQAINTTNEGAWEIDFVANTARVTGLFCRLIGADREVASLPRETWIELVHPDDRDIAIRAGELLGETGETNASYRVATPEGDWIWVHNRGRVVERDAEGNPLRANGLTSDITERRRLESRLEESERLLREAMEGAQYGAWSVHLPSRTARYSGFLQRLLGGSGGSTELPLDDFLKLLTPDSREIAEADFGRLEDGLSIQSDYDLVDADGHLFCILHQGRVVERDGQGRAVRAAGIVSDVTEERRLRRQVDESEQRFHEVLDAAGEGAWRMNLLTGIADISPMISELMGLPPTDARISFDDFAARVDPEDLKGTLANYRGFRARELSSFDEVVRYNSEKHGWIRIHNRGRVSKRNEAGEPVEAAGFITDVTENTEMAALLEESQRQLSDAVRAAGLGTWRVDFGDNTIALSGEVVTDLVGLPIDDGFSMPVRDWFERVHPDDAAELRAKNLALFKGDQTLYEVEYRIRNHAGKWVWYRVIGRVIRRNRRGLARVASGVLQEIDQTRRYADALDEEKQRFEAIYRATPAMLHTINASGIITQVSDFWLSYLGYERDEVIGRRSVDFLDAESRDRALQEILPTLFETGRNTNIPYRFIRKDGEMLDVLLSSFLERDENGQPLHSFAVMTDITPLRAAYEQLERSNRELDRFATVASHDLQEPLRKISAFSSLIRRRYSEALDAEGERCLDFLVDAAQRMQRLIDDLLVYSKMSSQALQMGPVDLEELIGDVRERLSAQINESGADFEIAPMPAVRGDRLLLGQVLQNLISNAVKYRSEAAPKIEISARKSETEWIISVRDNGIGFDPRFAEKIFAPFQRLHSREEYQGTGIGLAIVRQAIERHGGRIWVESAPDEGTCFSFALPAPQPVDLAS